MSDSWDTKDGSLPGSSVHGILQARILEWAAISFSRGSSRPRNWTPVSCTAARVLTDWSTRQARIVQLALHLPSWSSINSRLHLYILILMYYWAQSSASQVKICFTLHHLPLLYIFWFIYNLYYSTYHPKDDNAIHGHWLTGNSSHDINTTYALIIKEKGKQNFQPQHYWHFELYNSLS